MLNVACADIRVMAELSIGHLLEILANTGRKVMKLTESL